MTRPAIFLIAALAHHSLSGIYDTGRQVTMEGVVTEFRFINPHPFVMIEIKTFGEPEIWQFELDNRSELVQIGMTEKTLKQGDRLVVVGNPGRGQTRSVYVNRLDRPSDGLRYEQIGTTPRIRGPR